MPFEPVRTKADLDTLDSADILEGYMSAERGDPEPGPNRGRAFWHGWRNRMIDLGALPRDEASLQLARECISDKKFFKEPLSPEQLERIAQMAREQGCRGDPGPRHRRDGLCSLSADVTFHR